MGGFRTPKWDAEGFAYIYIWYIYMVYIYIYQFVLIPSAIAEIVPFESRPLSKRFSGNTLIGRNRDIRSHWLQNHFIMFCL